MTQLEPPDYDKHPDRPQPLDNISKDTTLYGYLAGGTATQPQRVVYTDEYSKHGEDSTDVLSRVGARFIAFEEDQAVDLISVC